MITSFRILAVSVGILVAAFAVSGLVFPSLARRAFDFLSRLGQRFESRCFYLPFCFGCFLIFLMLGLLLTQSGSGISPDSTGYIVTGKNIFLGNGFYAAGGLPYVAQPPLYPLTIAALMHIGFGAEQAARLVPILCFALLMFPIFSLGRTIGGFLTGYMACLLCLIFYPLLLVTSFAWTEMIYIFISVLSILFLVKFGKGNGAGTKILCVAGLFTALAILTKYLGITLLVVGLIVIALKNRSRLKRTIYQALLFGSISVVPILPWLYRNVTLTGSPTGSRAESTIGLLANAKATIGATLGDFVPLDYVTALTTSVALFVIFTVCVKLYSTDRKILSKYPVGNYILILYIVVYLVALVIMRSLWHFDSIGTRLTCPAYPFLILVVTSFVLYASSRIEVAPLRATLFSAIAIVGIFFLFSQAPSLVGFYGLASQGMGYNSPHWRNEEGIAWAASNAPDSVVIYSDRADAVEFRLNRLCRYLPYSGDEKGIEEFFEELSGQEGAVIICFKEDWRRSYLLSNDEIADKNQAYNLLVAVADFPESTIWCMR